MSRYARWLGALRVAAVCLSASSALASAAPVAQDIAVRIDPSSRELNGSSRIVIDGGAPSEVVLSQRFEVESITVDGRAAARSGARAGLHVWALGTASKPRTVEVRWHGMLEPLDVSLDHRQTLSAATPVSGTQGTFLPAAAAWYPQTRTLMQSYRVAIDLPADQRGLVPGRLVDESEAGGRYRARYEFPFPAEGIDLMAGPYRVTTRNIRTAGGNAVSLRTYFHPEIAELAPGYLDAVKGYLDLYESRIGEYPFSEFSIVSSPTPTGFGMPTLTYLGVEVMKLPFIRSTSLGHEILHNWWGNGVYPEYARGNWSEGLTTFMADYTYREREGEEAARETRLEWLRDFTAVPAGQDRPLVEFTSRTHGTSQIVGYDKAAMLFLMLRDLIGREAFDRGIRRFWQEHRFKTASWPDLQRSFEAAARLDLAGFFAQWLRRQGAPTVQMAGATRSGPASPNGVRITLTQDEPAYRLRVPLVFHSAKGEEVRHVDLTQTRGTFDLVLDARPAEVALDPDLRLLRRLGGDEAPPILRQVMLDPATRTVLLQVPAPAMESAQRLAASLQDDAPRMQSEAAPIPAGAPLLLIGLDDAVEHWLAERKLPAKPASLRGRGSATVWTAALPQGKSIAVISGKDAAALSALARPLPHYGRASYLVFDGPKAVERGVWPSRPQTWRFE
jgi:aminopeptidase N